MNEHRYWLGTVVMFAVAAQHSVQAATTRIAAQAHPADTSAHLTVFGIPHSAATGHVLASRLDGSLADIAQRYSTVSTDHPLSSLHAINPAARFRLSIPLAVPEVAIDAITTGSPRDLASTLQNLGLRDVAVFSNDVGGWLPVDQLTNAGALTELHFARASVPRIRAGVATQGDFAQRSAAVRTTYPALTGAGVTVGVLSDSFNCYQSYASNGVSASGLNGYASNGFTATYSTDQSTDAVPAGVNVLNEASCLNYDAPEQLPFSDEGRAILQIVHSVAPDAKLAFYTAVNTEADFASGIVALANAGAKVIDDDVGYADEPFFQDGLVAQAINQVASQGVAYFSAAGNDGHSSYENTAPVFTVVSTSAPNSGEKLLNFDTTGATTTTSLPLTIPPLFPGEFLSLVVEWDQPYVTGAATSGGASSSIDLCITGAAGTDQITDPAVFPNTVTCTGANSLGRDPVQILFIGNPANAHASTAAVNTSISIGLANGTPAPGRIKFLLGANGAHATINAAFATSRATIQGHPSAAGAAAVGAAPFYDTPQCGVTPATLETFSSSGGDPTLFDATGSRLTTPVTRQKPDFVGPDGANDTFLGYTLQKAGITLTTAVTGCENNSSYPNFFGTSAAAPHAAAAAALMLQANPALTPSQIFTALQRTALTMGGGLNYDDGYGFIQIDAAVAQSAAAAPTISISPASVTAGSAATLTWVAINTTNCSASGGWSGAQPASGTQSVTPTAAGSNTYTLTCTGANGSVSNSATLTVNAQSGGTGGGGGGSVEEMTLLSLGGLLLMRWFAGSPPRRKLSEQGS